MLGKNSPGELEGHFKSPLVQLLSWPFAFCLSKDIITPMNWQSLGKTTKNFEVIGFEINAPFANQPC